MGDMTRREFWAGFISLLAAQNYETVQNSNTTLPRAAITNLTERHQQTRIVRNGSTIQILDATTKTKIEGPDCWHGELHWWNPSTNAISAPKKYTITRGQLVIHDS